MCGGNNADVYFIPFSPRDRLASARLVNLYCAVDVVLGSNDSACGYGEDASHLSVLLVVVCYSANVTLSAPSWRA